MPPAETPNRREQSRDHALASSFPASDPAPAAMVQGARAVDAADLQETATRPPADATILARVFADAEAAKLALEAVVRDGPFDRRQAEIADAGETVRLTLRVATDDAERLRGLLDR